MRKLKVLILVAVAAISGCTSINTNVAAFGDEYYRLSILKSENHHKLKEYLLENNIKLYSILSYASKPMGTRGSFMIDGKARDFVNLGNIGWIKAIMNILINSELDGVVVSVEGSNTYTLTYCGDYSHSYVEENGKTGDMKYTYYLSNMSENQHQTLFKSPMQPDCEISGFLGDVFYKKNIQVSSSVNNAKVSVTQKDKNKPITNEDNVALILKDMADQAMTALLTDGEMLQALKNYRLTGTNRHNQ